MAAQKEKEQRFDQVKLQGMHEPLTVRVEKMRGNVRQPIELPPKGSEQSGFSPPGTGWTRDEVLQLENFILTKWSGGGYYEFTVTDAKGDRMTWQGVWDPRLYPEKIPPNTAEAAMYGAAPPPVAGPQNVPTGSQPLGFQQQTGWPPNGNSLGYNNPPHTGPVMAPQQQPPQAPAPAMAPAPQQPPQAPPMWAPQVWNANPTQPPWNGPQPWGYTPTPGFQPGYGQQPYGMPGYPPPPPPYGYGGRASRFQDDELGARRARFFDDDDKEKRETERRETERRENEKRDLEAKLRQAELNHKEMEYKATLDRIQQQQTQQLQQVQQQHALQMQTLQEELRRIGEGRNKGEDDEVRRAREEATRIREAQQTEMQRLREQAQAEQAALQRQLQEQQLIQMRQASDSQVALLRDQLARMAEAPKGETDEFRRLRDEQDRQAREFERQRQEQERRLEVERAERERERERYDRERREEMLQREMREQAAATERRFEQLTLSRNQNDPMIDAMKENARMNAEQMREIARMQADSTNRMSQFMVAPMQLAQIMKDNSSGSDGLMKNVVDSVGGIVGMYKNAAETIMQMSGGGGEPPAVRLIQEGIGRASEVAERFLAVKRDSVISEAKVKTAEAQRDQTKIQAEASLRAQAMHAQAQAQQRQWAPPPPVANANGLGGTQQGQQRPQPGQPQQAQPQQPQQPQARPAANGQPKRTGPIDDQVPDPVQPKRTGPIDDQVPEPPVVHSTAPSEEEVFGMAYESVQRLRRGVAEGKLTPQKTVDAVLQGVEHVVTNNLVIPAFVLFQQERWADFIDVMLPNAPQEFKDECIRILTDEIEVGDPNEPEADAS